MNDAKAKSPDVGVTTKTRQHREEPARLTWTTQKPTTPGLSTLSRCESLCG